jgi:hypothetical protein
MVAQVIVASGPPNNTGGSIQIRNKTTNALVASGSATETSSGSTVYTTTVNDAAAGTYRVFFLNSSGEVRYEGQWVTLLLVAGTYVAYVLPEDEFGISSITNVQLAAITVESGVISSFPETLTIGDSYTENTGQIKINISDSDGEPITALGTLLLAEATITFAAFRPNDSAQIVGTCEYFEEVDETYVLLTLPSTETAKGKAEYTYEGRLKFHWEGDSSGESDDEQKTFKTTPFKFIANP